jgi:TonB family protein
MLLLSVGVVSAQEMGPAAPPAADERPSAQYDVPPRLIRNWATPYTIPKKGPKRPPDDNVVLEILIDAKGRVARARVVKSIAFYDDIAIRAAKAWLFSPALKDGRPVAVRQLTSIHFGKMVSREAALLWDDLVAPSPTPSRPAESSVSASDPSATEPASPPPPESPSAAPGPVPSASAAGALAAAPGIEVLELDRKGAAFAHWLGTLAAEVSRSWRGSTHADLGSPCVGQFEIVVEADGTVSAARMVRRSGDAAFDRAALKALFGSRFSPLPEPGPPGNATILVQLSHGEPAATPDEAP